MILQTYLGTDRVEHEWVQSGDIEVKYGEKHSLKGRNNLGMLSKSSMGKDSHVCMGFNQGDFNFCNGC